jgi:hypothetical protein
MLNITINCEFHSGFFSSSVGKKNNEERRQMLNMFRFIHSKKKKKKSTSFFKDHSFEIIFQICITRKVYKKIQDSSFSCGESVYQHHVASMSNHEAVKICVDRAQAGDLLTSWPTRKTAGPRPKRLSWKNVNRCWTMLFGADVKRFGRDSNLQPFDMPTG